MKISHALAALPLTLLIAAGCLAQTTPDVDAAYLRLAQLADSNLSSADDEQLKLAALEGLMAASSERALPLIEKVLAGNHSQAVKARALFVLGQIDSPDAQRQLLDIARATNSPLQRDAIRTIGIGGNGESLAALRDVYGNGDDDVRESVLSAYLIAGEPKWILEIARDAPEEEFAVAVRMLGAMGAKRELRQLLDERGDSKGLVHAYAIAGDLASLQQLAARADDLEQRAQAIQSIGVIGGREAKTALRDLYRQANDETTRKAALQGLLISGDDEGVLALFRDSRHTQEKRELLKILVVMGSDLAFEVIDATLEDN